LRIISITVRNLFGLFDHDILMNLQDRITIIRGPNGIGKTVMLKMVHGLIGLEWTIFRKIPFTKFELNFDNGLSVWVEKEKGDYLDGNHKGLKVHINSGSDTSIVYDVPARSFDKKILINSIFGRNVDSPSKSKNYQFNFDDIEEYMQMKGKIEFRNNPLPKELISLKKEFNIHIIETQRLFATNKREDKLTNINFVVDTYAKELAEQIRSKLAESTSKSQSLEKSFPRRLVESDSIPSIDNIKDILIKIDRKRSRLIDAGILDREIDDEFNNLTLNIVSLRDEKRSALELYLSDMNTKLDFYDDLLEKIELYKDIINKRFKYKYISVNKTSGFNFTTNNKQILEPTDLSSGEQHEVVLLYELIFKVLPNTLIMIDEPEISLHVEWQASFVKDLQKIIKQSKFDVLIATHSPEIIGDRWDLSKLLSGGHENEW